MIFLYITNHGASPIGTQSPDCCASQLMNHLERASLVAFTNSSWIQSQLFSCCIWQAFCWVCRTPVLACRAGVFAMSMYSTKFCKSGGLSYPKKAVGKFWQSPCYTDGWVGGQFLQRHKSHFSNFERDKMLWRLILRTAVRTPFPSPSGSDYPPCIQKRARLHSSVGKLISKASKTKRKAFLLDFWDLLRLRDFLDFLTFSRHSRYFGGQAEVYGSQVVINNVNKLFKAI